MDSTECIHYLPSRVGLGCLHEVCDHGNLPPGLVNFDWATRNMVGPCKECAVRWDNYVRDLAAYYQLPYPEIGEGS